MEAYFSLPSTTATALLQRGFPEDTALGAWPTEPPPVRDAELNALVAGVLQCVSRDPGYAVVKIDARDLDDHEVCTVSWNLFTMMFQPTPQYRSGELIYPVEVVASSAQVSHYSGSNRSGGYHTDGTLLPDPPDVACLFGLSAAEGGETLLMDGPQLARQLELRDSAYLEQLRRPLYYAVNGQIDGLSTKRQPVFNGTGKSFELRYLRLYIEEGYEAAGVELPPELAAAMDAFDDISHEERNQTAVLLERGVALFWNNRRMLHGRRRFQETSTRRRLRRIYGTFAPSRQALMVATV